MLFAGCLNAVNLESFEERSALTITNYSPLGELTYEIIP